MKRFIGGVLLSLSLATIAFSSGWLLKAYQDRNDLKPKFVIGQKVTINQLEKFVDDGTSTSENFWYREKRHYLSNGKAFVAGIEWWPTKHNQTMSYWIGSTDSTYRSFDGYSEVDISVLK